MDGTLLNSDKKVSEANRNALQAAINAGIKVVLCTGRPLYGVTPIFDVLALDSSDDYVIVNNGCSTHKTGNWQLTDWTQLTKIDLVKLHTMVQNSTDVQLVLTDETRFFVVADEPSELVTYDAGLVYTTPITMTLEEATSGEYTLFQAMIMGSPESIDAFQEQYESELAQDYSVVRSQEYIFEILPKGTTKASALDKLAKQLGIRSEEILALGDGNNDIEMLEYVGYGVAMANATDGVFACTSYRTTSHNEDGVAYAIEKVLRNEVEQLKEK